MWDQAFHICWACFPLCQEWTLVLFLWDFCKGSGYRTQRGFQMAQWYRLRLPMQETRVWSLGSVPGWAGSSGVWNVNSLQYFCQKNHMDRGAWQATVHRVAKSQIWLKWLGTAQPLYDFRKVKWHEEVSVIERLVCQWHTKLPGIGEPSAGISNPGPGDEGLD